jgi:hypothetical protein
MVIKATPVLAKGRAQFFTVSFGFGNPKICKLRQAKYGTLRDNNETNPNPATTASL